MTPPYDARTLYEEFEGEFEHYEAAAARAQALIVRELAEAGLAKMIVTARAKQPIELFKKQKQKGYPDPWADCPDILGSRVIVGTSAEKSVVTDTLRNSEVFSDVEVEDQTAQAKPGEIRYRGLHVHVRSEHLTRPNGSPIRCEVQVRTTAEHAWAETEHRYIYKGGDIPADIRRHFNRLLVLIELFDQQLQEGVNMASSRPEFQRLLLAQHLETLLHTFASHPSDAELTIDTLALLEAAGVGEPAELRGVVDSYVNRSESEINRVFSEHGPESDAFNISTGWLLSQGESLLFLALLDKDEYQLSNALAGHDLYGPVMSLALATGHGGFLRND